VAHAGKTFWTMKARPFTYEVEGDNVKPVGKNRSIPRNDLQDAFDKYPISGPGVINRTHQGPAYVWGILHDQRIIHLPRQHYARTQRHYEPLTRYLKTTRISKSQVTLSFRKIDMILRIALPVSAFKTRQWWGNDDSHVQARAWISAGFKVDRKSVDLIEGWVRFTRSFS
jgi:hypothetical protein